MFANDVDKIEHTFYNNHYHQEKHFPQLLVKNREVQQNGSDIDYIL